MLAYGKWIPSLWPEKSTHNTSNNYVINIYLTTMEVITILKSLELAASPVTNYKLIMFVWMMWNGKASSTIFKVLGMAWLGIKPGCIVPTNIYLEQWNKCLG